MQQDIVTGLTGNQTDTGPEPPDITPRSRVAQRSHHVRAIRNRDHPGGQRSRRAARRATRAARQLKRVTCDPEDRVGAMGAKTEFRHIGFANDNCARIFQATRQAIICIWHKIRKQRGPAGRAETFCQHQIFDRHRNAV